MNEQKNFSMKTASTGKAEHGQGCKSTADEYGSIYEYGFMKTRLPYNLKDPTQRGDWDLDIDNSVVSENYTRVIWLLKPWLKRTVINTYHSYYSVLDRLDWEMFRSDMESILLLKVSEMIPRYNADRGHFRSLLNSSLNGLLTVYLKDQGLGKRMKDPVYVKESNVDTMHRSDPTVLISDWIMSLDETNQQILKKIKAIGKKTDRKKFGVDWLHKEHFSNLSREEFRHRYETIKEGYTSIAS